MGDEAVALVCGAGGFPAEVAEAGRTLNRPLLCVALTGIADPALERYSPVWLKVGEIGKLLATLKGRNIRSIAFAGAMTRPDLRDLAFDWGAVRRLPDLARLLRGGDDSVLRSLIRFFEGEGLTVVDVAAIVPALLCPEGVLAGGVPSEGVLADIRLGFAALAAFSPFDTGQAVIVADSRVIAVEAAEGTDAMIERAGALRGTRRWHARGSAGVLVKGPKLGQDLRADRPAIGPDTVARCAAAGLGGLAIASGAVLVIDRKGVRAAAQARGLFVYGHTAAPA